MKKTLIWILVAANLSLGGTLLWRGTSNAATAAQVTKTPVRGKYTLIPGEASSSSSIIYVFDAANERVGAIAPDTKDMLVSMPTIGLADLFKEAQEKANAAGNANGNRNGPNNGNPRPGNRPAR